MTKSAGGDAVQGSSRDFPIVVAAMPATVKERKAALCVVILLMTAAAIIAPFASIQAGRVDAFIPVIQTIMCFADLITAALLLAQYSVEPRPAILAVACGYIASGMFAFLQTLAFPGAYGPAGVIGDGLDSAAWFFVLWHTSFPLSVLIYALLKDAPLAANADRRPTGSNIGLAIACTLAAIAALTWIVTAGTAYLPHLYVGDITRQTPFASHINAVMWLWGATALAVLFMRRRTILDLWLMVTLIAWMPNFLVAVFVTTVRFSVGWYAARGFALIASCTMLIVLLTESAVLYGRLANAIVLLRRERANRLMSLDAATSAMAHELRQPLTAIRSWSGAGSLWLNQNPPNIEKARDCIESIDESVGRADEIISSIRELFKHQVVHRAMIHVNDVARQAVDLMRQDLQTSAISVTTDFQDNIPEVHADRTQMQQVILNLLKNAIDAMGSTPEGAKKIRVATRLDGHSSVVLSIQDSGSGIAAENAHRVFDSFFTTKSSGMGLGLPICQTIVEEHGGQLRLVKTDSEGSDFEIMLPTASRQT
jgi:signal transduction histidine kinase